jgi:hypothetical protein
MNLPTAKEINPNHDPDGRHAEEIFLNKSLLDAELLFCKSTNFFEDLMFMGPKAFCYYIQAYRSYFISDNSKRNTENLIFGLSPLTLQYQDNKKEIKKVIPIIKEITSHVVENYESIAEDPEEDFEHIEDWIRFNEELQQG